MSDFVLTAENYYSNEANKRYCSASEFKQYVSLGTTACEARAVALLNGTYEEPKSDALIFGSIVDYLWEHDGDLTDFNKEHPDIDLYSSRGASKGNVLAKWQKAIDVYKRTTKDELFSQFMSGERQKIFTGTIENVPFKCKLDSYLPHKAIVDLKTTRSIRKPFRITDVGYVSFVEKYGYTTQMAIYQELVRQNTGETLPCFIAAVSKEDVPDIEIIYLDDEVLKEALAEVKAKVGNIQMLKNGEIEPIRCECCDYCKSTKKLTKAIHFSDILLDYTD